jgi:hypothetical protein
MRNFIVIIYKLLHFRMKIHITKNIAAKFSKNLSELEDVIVDIKNTIIIKKLIY